MHFQSWSNSLWSSWITRDVSEIMSKPTEMNDIEAAKSPRQKLSQFPLATAPPHSRLDNG